MNKNDVFLAKFDLFFERYSELIRDKESTLRKVEQLYTVWIFFEKTSKKVEKYYTFYIYAVSRQYFCKPIYMKI